MRSPGPQGKQPDGRSPATAKSVVVSSCLSCLCAHRFFLIQGGRKQNSRLEASHCSLMVNGDTAFQPHQASARLMLLQTTSRAGL